MNLLRFQRAIASLILGFLLCAGTAASASAQANTPQSLAGDWEFTANGKVQIMHLAVDASGAMTATVSTIGSTDAPIVFTDVHISGSTLIYTTPGHQKITEYIVPGPKMVGPYIWERETATTFSPKQLAGDWTTQGPLWGPLRLRLDSSGALTGTVETVLPIARRMKLSDIKLDGRVISFKTSLGTTMQGVLSKDGQSIYGDPLWQHTRTLPQALAEDAKSKPSPTDGTWTGTITHLLVADFVKNPPTDTWQFTFNFSSAPVSCTVDGTIQAGRGPLPCAMKLEGNKVSVASLLGVFQGTLTGDTLNGLWTVNAGLYNVGGVAIYKPMELNLTRTAPK